MAIDFNGASLQLLLRQYEKGNVVLFAGAGFSLGARNPRGGEPPLGGHLAQLLAAECGWKYDGEELPIVYAQAEAALGTRGLADFLAGYYRDCRPATWHLLVAKLMWYRIYTINIDDVLQHSYGAAPAQQLNTIVCPAPYETPDVWYGRVQCVHLHGSVSDRSKPLTFTLQDFAGQTVAPKPWYQALVEDLFARSVVFVGTRLSEPPFQHYLRLRSERPEGAAERRAKAFLVIPNVSAIWRRQYEDQGFEVIDSTAEEFLTGFSDAASARVPDQHRLLANRYPHAIGALAAGILDSQADLLRQFDYVTADDAPTAGRPPRTQFFLGAEPTWDDIRRHVDANRGICTDLVNTLSVPAAGLRLVLLVGQAGSGKSTTLRRVAYELARAGHTVYYSKAAGRIDSKPIVDLEANIGARRVFFFIDDAAQHLGLLDELATALQSDAAYTFVVSDRPHVLYPRIGALKLVNKTEVEMPPLDQPDCERILEQLGHWGYLGVLQGRSRPAQLREFLGRSRKQLLVAMKEATSGRGFDAIIADEYTSLGSDQARLVYTIACFAYIHGAPVRRRHLLASMDGSDLERASVLRDELRDVIGPWKESEDLLCPRHRVVATEVITEAASASMKVAALTQYMTQISGDITPETISRRTPEYRAFKGLIRFDSLQNAFGDDYEMVAGVYDALHDLYSWNFLYWLQRGRAEVYFDNFATAENYLQQSLAIRSDNFQALHYMGVLHLKRACCEVDPARAQDSARRGEDILRQQIVSRGATDPYPAAALVDHKLKYLQAHGSVHLRSDLQELYQLALEAHRRHPFDVAVREVYERAFRVYLLQRVTE